MHDVLHMLYKTAGVWEDIKNKAGDIADNAESSLSSLARKLHPGLDSQYISPENYTGQLNTLYSSLKDKARMAKQRFEEDGESFRANLPGARSRASAGSAMPTNRGRFTYMPDSGAARKGFRFDTE